MLLIAVKNCAADFSAVTSWPLKCWCFFSFIFSQEKKIWGRKETYKRESILEYINWTTPTSEQKPKNLVKATLFIAHPRGSGFSGPSLGEWVNMGVDLRSGSFSTLLSPKEGPSMWVIPLSRAIPGIWRVLLVPYLTIP